MKKSPKSQNTTTYLSATLKREFSEMYVTTKKVARFQTPRFGVLKVHARGTY